MVLSQFPENLKKKKTCHLLFDNVIYFFGKENHHPAFSDSNK